MEEDMLGAALVVRFGFDLQSIVRVDEDDGTPCHSRQRLFHPLLSPSGSPFSKSHAVDSVKGQRLLVVHGVRGQDSTLSDSRYIPRASPNDSAERIVQGWVAFAELFAVPG